MKSEKVKNEKVKREKDQKQGAGKERIAAVIAAIVIVVFLGGSVFAGLAGSGIAGKEKSRVSKKELEKAGISSDSEEESNIQVLALDKDIVISKDGTASDVSADTSDASSDGDYIFPNSDKEYLTDADVSGLSKDQLRIARNEIMARHGRIFDSQDLKDYFGSKSWYSGTISPSDFDANMNSRLSAVELANVEMIKKYE